MGVPRVIFGGFQININLIWGKKCHGSMYLLEGCGPSVAALIEFAESDCVLELNIKNSGRY